MPAGTRLKGATLKLETYDSGGIVYDSSNKTLGIVSAIEIKSGKPTGVVWYMKVPNINIKFGIERY